MFTVQKLDIKITTALRRFFQLGVFLCVFPLSSTSAATLSCSEEYIVFLAGYKSKSHVASSWDNHPLPLNDFQIIVEDTSMNFGLLSWYPNRNFNFIEYYDERNWLAGDDFVRVQLSVGQFSFTQIFGSDIYAIKGSCD